MSACCSPGRAGSHRRHDPARPPGTGVAVEPEESHPRGPVPHAADWSPDRGLGLVPLRGGTFTMGCDGPEAVPGDGEGPAREVVVAPFAIDAHCVSNDRFAAFVAATGHVTEAEQQGWSFVFEAFVRGPDGHDRVAEAPWWVAVPGARWAAPEGPGSDLAGRGDHPVVHVSWQDARAYCRWAGVRLPTEAEWEYAARGGLQGARFPWGDDLHPAGRHVCNVWQGSFPVENTLADGWFGTAPVDSFTANGYGLHNVAGNVWEWTADPWSVGDLLDPGSRVIRGGSYLCHASYCTRYRVSARTSTTPDSTTGHQGFRVAL